MSTPSAEVFILEQRGFFWWSDEPIPAKHWGPISAVAGQLKIRNDGQSSLHLDSILAEGDSPFDSIFPATPDPLGSKTIAGKLRTGEYVLLGNLRRNGGRVSTDGISYSTFAAMECLTSEKPLAGGFDSLRVNRLTVDLTEYAEWMRRQAITVAWSRNGLQASFKKQATRKHTLKDSQMSVTFSVIAPWISSKHPARVSKAVISETIRLSIALNSGGSIADIRERFGSLEDFLILLTDCEHSLSWPVLQLKKNSCTYYFARTRSEAKPPTWHHSWVSFPLVEENFGQLFEQWCAKRDIFGPGFYLYLGNRRGMRAYAEHRFASLIWGLESFHRTKYPEQTQSTSQAERLRRITAQVSDPRDIKWLSERLKNTHEPRLEDRVFTLICELPLSLDRKLVRQFSQRCASMRNDISHFGGRRDKSRSYSHFVQDVIGNSIALTHLFHALLLHEIGVSDDILIGWFDAGHRSYELKSSLVQVGLLASTNSSLRTVAGADNNGASMPTQHSD